MKWIALTDVQQLAAIDTESRSTPCLLFKHSTRCNISAIAKMRLEDDWKFEETVLKPYYLDLLAHRNISAAIAERYSVYHESPQVLIIQNGECTFDASHLDISVGELQSQLVS
jgi:bacillithiol system protein YtxJ